jgi:hypothetical protein
MKGVFGLGSHLELAKKLEWEFEQLIAKPNNAYHAYNFFVTAWHLVEWKYPDLADTSIRNKLREQTPLLQICEHLAVGAKHFEPRSAHLNAVSGSKKSGVWADGVWAANAWGEDVWETWLEITLTGEAQKMYGDRIRVDELARKVMDYWRASL